MIRSSDDLPEPLAPMTPILAPGKKANVMFSSTFLSGGCTFVTSRIVNMNSGMAPEYNATPRHKPGVHRERARHASPPTHGDTTGEACLARNGRFSPMGEACLALSRV